MNTLRLGVILVSGILVASAARAADVPINQLTQFDQIEIRDPAPPAAGAPVPVGPPAKEVWIGGDQGMAKLGTLETLPKGTPMYHWGPDEVIKRWGQHGKIDQGELDFLMKGAAGERAGGGAYASMDILDSKNFGPKLAVFEMPHDIPLIHSLASFTPENWPKVQALLRQKGIEGIHYNNNWYNFIDTAPISSVHVATANDFYQSKHFLQAKQGDFVELSALEQTVGLQDSPWLAQNFPELVKVVKNQPMSAAELDALWEKYKPGAPGAMLTMQGYGADTEVGARVRHLFHDRYVQMYRDQIAALAKDPNYAANKPAFMASYADQAMQFDVRPQELFPELKQIQSYIPALQYRPIANVTYNDFAKNYIKSIEMMDLNDLLAEIAKGNPHPWEIYDVPGKRPLTVRWDEAQTKPGIMDVYKSLVDDPNAGLRDTSLSSSVYTIDAHQKEALEANPYLVTDIQPDPKHPGMFTASHQYPSAATYKKFKDQLSPQLQADLAAAEQAGKLVDGSPEFKALTLRINTELLEALNQNYQLQGVARHQALMAIHPFPGKDNDLVLRAWYKRLNGAPLVINNPDLPLLLSPEEAAVYGNIAARQYQQIIPSISAEILKDPNFPHFYQLPDLWQIAADAPNVGADPAAFVAKARAFYADPKNDDLIHKRLFSQLTQSLHQQCVIGFIRGIMPK